MEYPPCKRSECENSGRYDSGYCALCDNEYNDGKGRRLFDLANERKRLRRSNGDNDES